MLALQLGTAKGTQSLEVGLESKYLPILFNGSDLSHSVYVSSLAADSPGCADSGRSGVEAVRNELQLLSWK
jgi:hypothetical protein